MYDRAVVPVHGMLTNVHLERNRLRKDFEAAREATAAAVRNECLACARETEAVAARDNTRTQLMKVLNSLTRFRDCFS